MCFPSSLGLYAVLVIPRTDGCVNAQGPCALQGVQPGAAGFGVEEDLKQGENLGSASIHKREMEKGAAPEVSPIRKLEEVFEHELHVTRDTEQFVLLHVCT